MQYIARTLLYDKRLVERADPETGELRLVEFGYIAIGEPIELDDARAEIMLAQGAIAPAPVDDTPAAEIAPATPKRR